MTDLASTPPRSSPPPARHGAARPVRVMIVDDSLVVRTVIARVIAPERDIEIVAKTGSAELAIAQLARTPADVMLLDLEMPGMGGLEALPKILAAHPDTQVLVVSSLTEAGAEHTIAALSMGAADTMLKPRTGEFDEAYRKTLIDKIRALGHRTDPGTAAQPATAALSLARRKAATPPRIVAIAASTGGIHALGILLRNLPARVSVPILVAQHLPASFADVFAHQLETASGRDTLVVRDGMRAVAGQIYVAGGDGHIVVRRQGDHFTLATTNSRAPSGCTPSADPLFESLAQAAGPEALAIVLSGMGRDGSLGAADLVAAGGSVLVQDQPSCAVWGMPGSIAKAGHAEAILAPDQLAEQIAIRCAGAA